jgi:RHS repeat-associated protein
MDRVTRTEQYGDSVLYNFSSYFAGSAPAEVTVVINGYDANGNLDTNQRYVDRNGTWQSYMYTTYTYDRADRQVTVSRPLHSQYLGMAVDSTVYDPAGNPVATITPRGHAITMQYDALDRVTRRVLPQVTYALADCSVHGLSTSWCPWVFPLYPDSGSGLVIAADTEAFAYDVMGNTTYAANGVSRIRRTYNKNGAIATETDSLRKYTNATFGTHVYALRFAYDLNGRRDTLYHPSNLAPSQGSTQTYQYATFGPLSEVRNVFGNRYKFFYDAAGRLDSLAVPGGWETYTYDDDGRRTARVEKAGATTLHDDDFTYDKAGHVRAVTGTGGHGWTVANVYTGSGGLLATDLYDNGGLPHFIEEYQTDGLANVSAKRVDEGVNDPKSIYLYDDFSGLLDRIVSLEPPYPPEGWQPDTTYNLYDEAGNVRYSGWRHPYDNWWALRGSANFYRADGKLLVTVVYRDSVLLSTGNRVDKRGRHEEYWYDALGRRVLVRRRGDDSFLCYGADYCKSSIERFVWDGDQLLYELRAPGSDSDPLDDTPPYTGDDTKYGWVGYTHGPGLDAPLDLFRMDFDDLTRVVLPHTNWRGAYDAGTDTTGTELVTWDFQFPASYRNAFHSDPEAPFRDLPDWFGSLIQDKADESGLIYMRNRYYDPATGRFTQEDPIGLAGGLNLYGFASGDPINFGDPFGLTPDPVTQLVKKLSGWFVRKRAPKMIGSATANELYSTFYGNANTGGAAGVGLVVMDVLGLAGPIGIEAETELEMSRCNASGGGFGCEQLGFPAPTRGQVQALFNSIPTEQAVQQPDATTTKAGSCAGEQRAGCTEQTERGGQ